MGLGVNKAENSVGALAAYLPADGVPWYKKPHLLKLNAYMISFVLFCKSFTVAGYSSDLYSGIYWI
jgi:hypothetical protein